MAIKRPVVQHEKGAIAAKSGVMFGDGVWLFTTATTPSDGTSGDGAGWAGKGSICVALDAGEIYTNTGTKASPSWTNQT